MNDIDSSGKHNMLSKYGLAPQEEMLDTAQKKKKFSIGIPKEITMEEGRIPLAPLAVELLVENGHQVLIEKGAGMKAHFSDTEYADCGADIVDNAEEIYQSDIILKIAPLSKSEIDKLKGKQIIISALHATCRDKEYYKKLIQKKVIAIAFDFLKDSQGCFPIVRSMSEIAGRSSILIAAEYLSNAHEGKGEMFGGVTGVSPSDVVILGAGTAGEFAASTALGLGATVKVFDASIHKLKRIKNTLGQNIFTSIIQPQVLLNSLKRADVAIGAVRLINESPKYFVTEDMVKQMKRDSIIIDISIDQGGCFETSHLTTHSDPVFRKHNVIHYGVPNIAARVARTASYSLSNILAPVILEFGESGSVLQFLKEKTGIRKGVYIYNGIIANQFIGSYFDMYSRDIDLLISAL